MDGLWKIIWKVVFDQVNMECILGLYKDGSSGWTTEYCLKGNIQSGG